MNDNTFLYIYIYICVCVCVCVCVYIYLYSSKADRNFCCVKEIDGEGRRLNDLKELDIFIFTSILVLAATCHSQSFTWDFFSITLCHTHNQGSTLYFFFLAGKYSNGGPLGYTVQAGRSATRWCSL